MHELSIAKCILDIIRQSVPKDKYSQAELVKIKIGKLSNVFPETLQFSFDAIKEESGFKNIHLQIAEETLHLLCNDCGTSFDSPEIVFNCIYCQSSNLQIINGDMLQVSEVILKEE